MLRQHLPEYPDTGFQIDPTNPKQCWDLSMQDYANQVVHHCHRCLVPMRGHGELSQNVIGTETTTRDMVDIYKTKDRFRRIEVAHAPVELTSQNNNVVSYLENGRK